METLEKGDYADSSDRKEAQPILSSIKPTSRNLTVLN